MVRKYFTWVAVQVGSEVLEYIPAPLSHSSARGVGGICLRRLWGIWSHLPASGLVPPPVQLRMRLWLCKVWESLEWSTSEEFLQFREGRLALLGPQACE